jgi:peroxiredoxin
VRLVLSAVFLLAGATKIVNLAGFQKVLPDFGIPGSISRSVAFLLPIAELIVAAALVPAKLAWYGAWAAFGLLIIFILAAALAMWRGRKPDCNCFGQLYSTPVGLSTVIRNAVLAVFALSLVGAGRLHSGPELWTWLGSLQGNQRKSAIVGGCIIFVCFLFIVDRARAGSSEPETTPPHKEPRAPQSEEPSSGSLPAATGIGLPMGTAAPDFELPSLSGETYSLQSLRGDGRKVLLIFSSPYCEPCAALVPDLMRWMRAEESLPNIVLISRGSAKDNLSKLKGLEPSRVLLQRGFEVSDAYDSISTPTGVVVGGDGLIQSGLAVGRDAIRELIRA